MKMTIKQIRSQSKKSLTILRQERNKLRNAIEKAEDTIYTYDEAIDGLDRAIESMSEIV